MRRLRLPYALPLLVFVKDPPGEPVQNLGTTYKRSPSDQPLASGPAAANNLLFPVSVIVVSQLLTLANRARRPDPNDPAGDVHVAVRLAGVVDKARDVAADCCVNDRSPRQLEAPDVPTFPVPTLALQALPVRDLLAGVIDDTGVLGDLARGVDAPSVNVRSPLLDH